MHLPATCRLEVPVLRMADLPAPGNHCVPTAITAVISFSSPDAAPIPDLFTTVFNQVRESGFHPRWGVMPWRISAALGQAARQAGLAGVQARTRYLWSLRRQVMLPLSQGLPVILNIGWGRYRQHTIVVHGYEQQAGRTRLLVADGWSGQLRSYDPRDGRVFGIGPYIASATVLRIGA